MISFADSASPSAPSRSFLGQVSPFPPRGSEQEESLRPRKEQSFLETARAPCGVTDPSQGLRQAPGCPPPKAFLGMCLQWGRGLGAERLCWDSAGIRQKGTGHSTLPPGRSPLTATPREAHGAAGELGALKECLRVESYWSLLQVTCNCTDLDSEVIFQVLLFCRRASEGRGGQVTEPSEVSLPACRGVLGADIGLRL